jgi:dolichol-phosphate mannosyltransferase
MEKPGQRLRILAGHWLKFNIVGLMGVIAQLLALKLLTGAIGLNYLIATGLAVEIAVLHNFFWHDRWTWQDRQSRSMRQFFSRLLRFNGSAGLISIIGNLIFMKLLAGWAHLPITIANLITIAICSIFNFLVSNNFVFRKAKPPSALSA